MHPAKQVGMFPAWISLMWEIYGIANLLPILGCSGKVIEPNDERNGHRYLA